MELPKYHIINNVLALNVLFHTNKIIFKNTTFLNLLFYLDESFFVFLNKLESVRNNV